MPILSSRAQRFIIIFLVLTAVVWSMRYVLQGNTGISFRNSNPIKVGVLHSLSGTMALSEQRVADATLLAIEEINARGGLLGRQVLPILRDGSSDASIFAFEAEELIKSEDVAVVFGCWTSVSRKTVKPIFEQYDHLLFYPVQYEGMEMSPNIVYLGSAPNQQIIPAVKWALDNLGKRVLIVGSDYVFPRAAAEIIKDQLRSMSGTLTGEYFIPLGSTDVNQIVDAIAEKRPDVVLNLLNGDSNLAFFTALRARGVTSAEIPTISFSIAETEIPAIGLHLVEGDYAAWNYFQSLPGGMNALLVERFKRRFGEDVVVSDPMISAYLGVMFWAEAVNKANSINPKTVRLMLAGLSLQGPQGPMSVDSRTFHVWKPVYIGRIQSDGQFSVVWESSRPVRPQPFPPSRTPLDWNVFLDSLYLNWGGSWEYLGRRVAP
jgi:urea transport system substrate-binding protein